MAGPGLADSVGHGTIRRPCRLGRNWLARGEGGCSLLMMGLHVSCCALQLQSHLFLFLFLFLFLLSFFLLGRTFPGEFDVLPRDLWMRSAIELEHEMEKGG